jgi:sporulation protein YlmC with PRC-barrel domain
VKIMLRSFLPVASLLGLSVGTVMAQATTPRPPTPPPAPTRPADPAARPATGTTPAPATSTEASTQAYRVKQVLGTKVSLKDGLAIGTVDDVVFNDQGQIEYLIVNNDSKLVTVPWEAAKFNFEQQTATISITPEQYREIPTYTTTNYPVFFEPAYRTRVYGWYGLHPRPWRR